MIAIFIISLIPLLSLLRPGMFVAHDSEAHIVRLYSFYHSLTEGNLFPRWSQILNAGYGHPVQMFLYPLPSYLASLFHFTGLGYVDSLKLTLAITFIGSGIFMYLWLKKHFSNQAALVGALVWQLAPYRFVNLYVRNALGEHVAFMFIPLCLLAFNRLLAKPSATRLIYASLSLAGLILAHNAVSLMFLPFLFLYILIQKPYVRHTFLAVILGFSLSAFFWIPAFAEGKYTLRNIIFASDAVKDHFPTLKQLIVPSWGYGNSIPGKNDDLSFQIGIVQWLAFLSSLVLFFRRPKLLTGLALATFLTATLLLLPISLPLYKLFPIIKKFQFPWRFLIMPVFASSVLGAFVIDQIKPKTTLVVIVALSLLWQNHRYFNPQLAMPPEDQIIREYLGTSDTGESSPLWAVRFQEKRADDILGVVHGAPIDYQVLKLDTNFHHYTITASVPTQVADNTLYFPGWQVFVDGKKVGPIFTDPNWRGVITYPVPVSTHDVIVTFKETNLRKAANAITLTSFAFVALGLLYAYKNKIS